MKKIHYSTKAKKDLKRYRNNPVKMEALYKVLDMLICGKKIPKEYKPHKLVGEYKGCMECHIENDFLLIWWDEVNNLYEYSMFSLKSIIFVYSKIVSL